MCVSKAKKHFSTGCMNDNVRHRMSDIENAHVGHNARQGEKKIFTTLIFWVRSFLLKLLKENKKRKTYSNLLRSKKGLSQRTFGFTFSI